MPTEPAISRLLIVEFGAIRLVDLPLLGRRRGRIEPIAMSRGHPSAAAEANSVAPDVGPTVTSNELVVPQMGTNLVGRVMRTNLAVRAEAIIAKADTNRSADPTDLNPSQTGPVRREESMTKPHQDVDSTTVRPAVTDSIHHPVRRVADDETAPADSDGTDHQVRQADLADQEHRRVIAIDGPAAAGKTTVAKALAERLGATYLDTGLLYRAVTLAATRAGLSPSDGAAIADLARQTSFEIQPASTVKDVQQILVDGENVTSLLRTPAIDRLVSEVSAHPPVREAMLPIQRDIASYNTVIMVGRDITTVVVPNAGVKVYLDASASERARRRLAERVEGGGSGDLGAMLHEIEERDRLDSTRAVAPLRAGEGVAVVETDGLTVDQVVSAIADIAERTWATFDR